MSAPSATYRLQLGPEFGFDQATALVPYLSRLGISTLYLSPILAAQEGSEHGYDVTDPTRLNAELGDVDQFRGLAEALRRHDMGLLLDIVPNHMAVNHRNPWWVETLAEGRHASHARVFDIDWDTSVPGLAGKILLPFLGKPFTDALDSAELKLEFDGSRVWVCYFDHRYPLSWESIRLWLRREAVELPEPAATNGGDRLKQLLQEDEGVRQRLTKLIDSVNEGERAPLAQLMMHQHYRLAYWRTAGDEINYRRFFTITDLVGVNVEDPWVFAETHGLVFDFLTEGSVTGLRIDHIDGLARPREYLDRLHAEMISRTRNTGAPYIIVEKILCGNETLPDDWPVAGTTGYDFLDRVNRLFVDKQGLDALRKAYADFVGTTMSYEDVRYQKKNEVVNSLFPGELHRLAAMLKAIAATDPLGQDISQHQFSTALRELTVSLDIYRTYLDEGPVADAERDALDRALEGVPHRNPLVDPHTLRYIRQVLLNADERDEARQEFIRRWQQFTGPVMAKGLEDTTHYSYFPLCSLNDVGSEADNPAIDLDKFHQWNLARVERGDKSLNATSTHDTKRSEDVRARINVLSEMAEWWQKAQSRWRQWNESNRPDAGEMTVPDPVLETLIYQTLLGMWPLNSEEIPSALDRVKQYLIKAARERKEYTRWIATNVSYEDSVGSFVDAILADHESNRFLKEFRRQQRRIALWGHLNALSQLLLKIASPGVPDIYRGTELWDLSLVDPDNRRPIDLNERDRMLRELDEQFKRRPKSLFQELNTRWFDGRIKLFVTARALRCRRADPDLFLNGAYRPLYAEAGRRQHVCAFARQFDGRWAVAAAPRFVVKLSRVPKAPLGRAVWADDRLILSEAMPRRWRDAFTHEIVEPGDDSADLPLRAVFRHLPVALLIAEN